MSFYVDTSLLVSACTSETKSGLAQHWLEDQDAGALLISEWTRTEFAAAISMKVRSRALPKDERAEALGAFARLLDASFRVLPVTSDDFVVGARFADQYAHGLRAGDALHLAICYAHGCALATLDADQFEACAPLGITTARIEATPRSKP